MIHGREADESVTFPVRKLDGAGFARAVVDPVDGHLRRYSWWLTRDGYARRTTSRRAPGVRYPIKRTVYLHREIAGLQDGDVLEVHHANYDPLDCRRRNLWVCTKAANLKARRGGRRNAFRDVHGEQVQGRAAFVPVGNPVTAIAYARELHAASRLNQDLLEVLHAAAANATTADASGGAG